MHRYKMHISISLILCQCVRKCRIAKSVSEDFSRHVDRPRPLSLTQALRARHRKWFSSRATERGPTDRPTDRDANGAAAAVIGGRMDGRGARYIVRRFLRTAHRSPDRRHTRLPVVLCGRRRLAKPKFVRVREKTRRKGGRDTGDISHMKFGKEVHALCQLIWI